MAARGYLFVLLAAIMWGSLGPVARYAFSQGIDPLEVAFWRCIIPFFPFCFQALRQGNVRIDPADRPMVAGFGLFCIAAFYGAYQLAIEAGGAALASVLMYTAPAWVALMAWGFLGERMTAAKLAAVAATLAGVAAVSGVLGADSTVTMRAIFFGVLSGVTYAMYYIFGKRLQPKYTTPQLFLYSLPLGALLLLPFVEFHHKTPEAWLAIVTVALLSTWGAYSAYFAGLKHIEATRASVVATIEPLVAAITAYAWWGERFTSTGYLGSLLILGAVGLIVWDGRNTNGGPEPALPQRSRRGTT
ncbi:MAG: EamA family transporter [Proteobacteria bacterium]|nr:EamA family transporter [Pseudomonadota bacterium]